ncbi:MAG: ferrochelatase [Gammaproteobacteria bacterium]|nr:MAG: ferrochelatase [Gammaproteobacteria bacterium]
MSMKDLATAPTSADANGITVLLMNLGSPDSPDADGVRTYLAEFLSDSRVIEIPMAFWKLILHGIILRTRPKKVTHAYDSIWFHEQDKAGYVGAPLRVYGEKIRDALQCHFGERLTVKLAMRYGNPSVKDTLRDIMDSDSSRILVLPMYPQYSATTIATAIDQVNKHIQTMRFIPELRFVRSYWHEPAYLDAMANKIQTFWKTHARPDKLIFSYHGIPQRNVKLGDRYYADCLATTAGIVQRLALSEDEYLTTFQSRFGPQQWLQPYTDKTMETISREGVKSIHMLSPAFAADCLETLEELAILNRDIFLANGGESFEYIPALNDDEQHVTLFSQLIEKHIAGWE